MAEGGFGRNAPIDFDERAALVHRRDHLSAILALARKHDDERRRAEEIERELEDVDRAIAGGMEVLPEERRRRLLEAIKEERAHEKGETG